MSVMRKNNDTRNMSECNFQGSMNSAIYEGLVRHRRSTPKRHEFSYKVFMMYVDLDELPSILKLSRLWSCSRWALARFKREDFHGDPAKPLKEAIVETIESHCGEIFDGRICMLSNWRYFGINMNPLTTYYCFDRAGTLVYILAEVNNTPWNERRAYFLDGRKSITHDKDQRHVEVAFDKDFSVSPFHPLDMRYLWRSSVPGKVLSIHIENSLHEKKVFDATLSLRRRELSSSRMREILICYPFMTVKIVCAIYWQALRLFFKGVPFLGKDKLSSGARVR